MRLPTFEPRTVRRASLFIRVVLWPAATLLLVVGVTRFLSVHDVEPIVVAIVVGFLAVFCLEGMVHDVRAMAWKGEDD